MTAKRLMLLSLILSAVGIAILLLNPSKPQSEQRQAAAEVFKRVLVAKQGVVVGQPYTLNMFQWKSVSEQELNNYLDFISEEEFSRLDLKPGIAHTAIQSGQVMSSDDFETPASGISMAFKVQSGHRAISVPVDAVTANSGFVQPGDKVDILLLGSQVEELKKYDNQVAGLYVTTIAIDVRVLAFNQYADPQDFQKNRSAYGADIPDNSSVSLEVTPEQATQIVLANQIGKLTLSLRGAGEMISDVDEKYTVTSTLINPDSKQVAPDLGLIQLRPTKDKN
ncbi:Flp pilus assembly protein CpaB [Vibrio orientalis CIP 102891 = ATCC 33934]|uniref:Flp pilus assembly protein CpaB n=1 Tax=Vibrio orientalis CIP 102891 = ATCC 33934 TaxID=675816 RepID=C9QEI7_VIBOR|nr:Flp pilus assembly protein CpaB [Vibrio orientalis]EEX94460.1 flp pilus assembly protein RcpC/CpaB [Vibrio orientalis CIP 102891 = ATCC 33934]EGU53990.1 Flp pilus assembly protein CpaB [Vibrio orientalis CIP 102891 = ATCC 33934]